MIPQLKQEIRPISVNFVDSTKDGLQFQAKTIFGDHLIVVRLPGKVSTVETPINTKTVDLYPVDNQLNFADIIASLRQIKEKSKNPNWIDSLLNGQMKKEDIKAIDSAVTCLEIAEARDNTNQSIIKKIEKKLTLSCFTAGALGAGITLLISYLYYNN
jgi:hypothetical protein